MDEGEGVDGAPKGGAASMDAADASIFNWANRAKGNGKLSAKKTQQKRKKAKHEAFARATFKVAPGKNPTSEIPKKLRVMVVT